MQGGKCNLAASFLAILVTAIFAMSSRSSWATEPWTLVRTVGEAWAIASQERSDLQTVQRLKPGDVIATGRTGQVVIGHGSDRATISPDAQVAISADNQRGHITLLHRLGTVIYSVGKRLGGEIFRVDTPHLAAIVKGTEFSIAVLGNTSAIHVIEGLVQVTTTEGGKSVMVSAGESLVASSNSEASLTTDTAFSTQIDPSSLETMAPAVGGVIGATAGIGAEASVGASEISGEAGTSAAVGTSGASGSASATLGGGNVTGSAGLEVDLEVGSVNIGTKANSAVTGGVGSTGAGAGTAGSDTGSSADSGTDADGPGGLGGALGGAKDAIGGLQ